MAVVQVINRVSTKVAHILRMLRAVTLLSLRYDCCIRARHVPGIFNWKADYLSRFQASPEPCRNLDILPHPDSEDHAVCLSIMHSDIC